VNEGCSGVGHFESLTVLGCMSLTATTLDEPYSPFINSISTEQVKTSDGQMVLQTLPYDLLLNVAQYLDLRDVHALQVVSFLFIFMICTDGDSSTLRRDPS
jgi:hypothetical protein